MANTKSGNRIYHYCNLDTAINHILPNLQLLANPLEKTNDPRENKSFIFSGTITNQEINDIEAKNERISKILRCDCKVICFCEDVPYGLFGFELSRMWDRYGGGHKGVCIELGKEEFIVENNIDSNYFRKISYYEYDKENHFNSMKNINYDLMEEYGEETYLKEHFRNNHLEYLYFTKNKEWESEHEIRLIHFSNDTNKEYFSIKNSIKNIFVGVDFEEDNAHKLVNVSPVDVFKLKFYETRMSPRIDLKSKK